ncbi:glycosyltransferase [Desulforudis sp. 1088]|uniref:glycosyltransferase family 4 protein n=1 Tax=unclassified Candidatus Desulforudis TaxID=2635950 RepID=UPI003CE4B745
MGTFIGKTRVRSIAMIGTYVPRKCGLATFAEDLCLAMDDELGNGNQVFVVAMDDIDGGYPYHPKVRFQIRDSSLSDYLRAAEFLNVKQPDIVLVQHEYGIFGGKSGAHILHLVKNLHLPVVTTLHTVLSEPSEQQRAVLTELAAYSEHLVVMNQRGVRMLQDIYGIPGSKISYIPHGIPDFAFVDPNFYKDAFDVEGRKVILSFGLMHPGKGFELVIKALPEVVAVHPEVFYIILGTTHPHVLKHTGDAYRHSLHQLVERLGLENHVRFDNKYVDRDELCQYIMAADIFVTPYKSASQITSGTLSYALGAGKAIISTPYWHAEELLDKGRGRFVPFDDIGAMAREINSLIENEGETNAMRKRAYQFGRKMAWKEVARSYLELFSLVLERRMCKPKPSYGGVSTTRMVDKLPTPNLDHLQALTDDTGILQHCAYTIPNRDHGYCLDDNARALIVACMYYSLYHSREMVPLIRKYLAFLLHAFNPETRRFRNFMSYDRHWLETVGSEDSHGRALWGLGVTVRSAPSDSIRAIATRIFNEGLSVLDGFSSPRAWALAIVGLCTYLEVYSGDAEVRRLTRTLSERLHRRFRENVSLDWPWCEDILTYDNAKLPHALLIAGRVQGNDEMLAAGLSVLQWLLAQQTAPEGHLSLIGNMGWMNRDGLKAKFDQQPLEAMALTDACVEAFRGTGDFKWIEHAKRCLNWFLGHNDLNMPLYDFTTGGCCDGLTPQGVNANQGAESTVSWLIALLTLLDIV